MSDRNVITPPRRPFSIRGARLVRDASALRDYVIVGAFVALFVALSFASDSFLTWDNLVNITNQWVPAAIMGLGLMIVLLTAGFDLSIGAVFALSSVVAASVANDVSGSAGLAAGIAVGVTAGTANGLLITIGSINPFVATIGTGVVCGGLATVITGGSSVTAIGDGFTSLGMTELIGLPLAIYIFAVVVLVVWFALNRMSYGRYLRSVGGNLEAARLSGLRISWLRASAFMIAGACTGFAGTLVASRSGTASSVGAPGLDTDVYTAVLLGGNSFGGGIGGVWRTLCGIGILALLRNGFNLLGVDPLYQQIASGGILLAAVVLDAKLRKTERAAT